MKCVYMTVVMLFSVFASLSAAAQAENPVHKDRSNLPITIRSNELTADNRGSMAVFSGNVVAKQGDITIFSDKLIVNYSEKNGDIDKVEAAGNVRIIQQNRTGIASQAVYDSREGRITLTGTPNPKVTQGADSVSGKVITFYVDDDKSYVTSGGDSSSRVEAVINPPARKGDAGAR